MHKARAFFFLIHGSLVWMCAWCYLLHLCQTESFGEIYWNMHIETSKRQCSRHEFVRMHKNNDRQASVCDDENKKLMVTQCARCSTHFGSANKMEWSKYTRFEWMARNSGRWSPTAKSDTQLKFISYIELNIERCGAYTCEIILLKTEAMRPYDRRRPRSCMGRNETKNARSHHNAERNWEKRIVLYGSGVQLWQCQSSVSMSSQTTRAVADCVMSPGRHTPKFTTNFSVKW